MPRSNSRSRSRSRSPDLPEGAKEISEKDYFIKIDEFRVWLKEEKGKYFDELTGEKARSYFRKFVKAWNRGKLSRQIYAGVDTATRPSASSTGYKWAFADNRSRVSQSELQAAREAVSQDTRANNSASDRVLGPAPPPRIIGPAPPPMSYSDRQLEREAMEEQEDRARRADRKRKRAEENERTEDIIGPREVGREGMLEKKKARREGDRSFRDKSPGGEVSEDVLMGGDSFQARIAQRDAARKRFDSKKTAIREEKEAASRERQNKLREKDKATMDMFQAMARERFG